MQIILGKYAGFCPGVKRAWDLVSREAKSGFAREKNKSIFILGELIHNQQAIARIEDWGIKTIDKLEEIREKKAVVFIRAHGEPPKTGLGELGKSVFWPELQPQIGLLRKL